MEKPLEKKTKRELIDQIGRYKTLWYELSLGLSDNEEAISIMQEIAVEYGMAEEFAPVWSCTVTFRGQAWDEESFKKEMERIKGLFLQGHEFLATGWEDGPYNEVEIGSIYDS